MRSPHQKGLLLNLGLNIYKEDHRAEGRRLARGELWLRQSPGGTSLLARLHCKFKVKEVLSPASVDPAREHQDAGTSSEGPVGFSTLALDWFVTQ